MASCTRSSRSSTPTSPSIRSQQTRTQTPTRLQDHGTGSKHSSPGQSSSNSASPKSTPKPTRKVPTLQLPPMPRFHPANYTASATSSHKQRPSLESVMTEPSDVVLAPITSQQRHRRVSQPSLSEAQQQLYQYHRDITSINNRPEKSPTTYKVGKLSPLAVPNSPRMDPKGSPGPILTPLELEEEETEGYFTSLDSSKVAAESYNLVEPVSQGRPYSRGKSARSPLRGPGYF